tara:strand:+ start:963 stop:1511 length:549 start_codon:yes stop_codon:yes gene_type:complete
MARLLLNNQVLVNENSGVVSMDSGVNYPKGTILNASFYENSTRTSISTSASSTLWSFSVTKLFSASASDLNLYLRMPGDGHYSDNVGIYAHIANSTTTTTDGTAYKDICYIQSNDSNTLQILLCKGKVFESLDAGSHTLSIGWNTRNGGSGERPFDIWNPNHNDDGRSHQLSSTAVVYEIQK